MPSPFNERIQHPCFPQPERLDRMVWRYVTLPKFISLLNSESLYLSRLDFLNDPHEGAFPRQMVEYRDFLYMKEGSLDRLPGHVLRNQDSRTCCYVNCWALSDFESEALWRLYCGPNEGIAIQSNYSKLIEVIRPDEELFLGCVTYLDYESQNFNNPWWPAGGNTFQPVMHKRLAFAHEQEVRIAKWLHHYHLSETDRPSGVSVPIVINDLIENIYISPYAPEWYSKVVQDVVTKFSPQLTSRVRWSKMKNAPLY